MAFSSREMSFDNKVIQSEYSEFRSIVRIFFFRMFGKYVYLRWKIALAFSIIYVFIRVTLFLINIFSGYAE